MASREDIYEIAPEKPGAAAERSNRLYEAMAKSEPAAKEGAGKLVCPKCGYDLRGTSLERCPECGLKITSRMVREAREGKRSFFREVYLKPLMVLAIGLGVSGAATVASDGAWGLVGLAIGFGLTIGIGWVVFFVLSVTWIGMDQPVVTSMVQLAGAYAGTFAVSSVLGTLPIGFIGWVIPMFVLVGLLSWLLDIEKVEAWVVALVSWAAILFLVMFVMAAMG